MKVIDFIDEGMRNHRARYAPHDWPQQDSEEWQQFRRVWVNGLISISAKKVEFDTASIRCGTNPPRFRSDHLPRIINEIEAIRLANQINSVPDDKEIAQQKSMDCEHCEGSGYRMVFHPKYDGSHVFKFTRNGKEINQNATPLATCCCLFGKYIRAGLEPWDRVRYPELQKILDGQSRWLYADPTEKPGQPCPMTLAELMAKINEVGSSVAIRPNPRNAQRQLDNWYVRFLVNILEAGPLPFNEVSLRAAIAGHADSDRLRGAADLARIIITKTGGQEVWSLE